ncbi:MAG: triphosphoribosyl-dephospho-CoA synthase [Planctomycetaceae bacterium]|nr:triphosphoribosyl-dephospho-CoA synthase [Planctomycetaceae bacterium]
MIDEKFDFTIDKAPLTVGQTATWACLLEAAIPKPGNVHRGADFEDLKFTDFLTAAVAIGPALERAAAGAPLGQTVLDAVGETRRLVATNANLGIVLLLAPLASAAGFRDRPLRQATADVLAELTPDDAALVYQAIRIAQPGGMGKSPEADIHDAPPADLLHAMRLAADRDSVAKQYANGFTEVFHFVVPAIRSGLAEGLSLADAVIRCHLRTMQAIPDTLIARKCGLETAQLAADYAGQVLRAAADGNETYHEALADFDFWLRSDGHRRNPGTTADLIAAGLFVVLRDATLPLPLTI